MKPCCDKFAFHVYKEICQAWGIFEDLDGIWNIRLGNGNYHEIECCPFCGKKLESEYDNFKSKGLKQ